MLLAVDVGNTDVTFGVFDGERLAANTPNVTSNQYRMKFKKSGRGN